MRVFVLGARGSTPAPGLEFAGYGGHTSCVALAHDGSRPTLVLDAGTGIRRLSALLGERPFRGSIMLGHWHWDHTQGIPFFGAGDRPDAAVTLYAPSEGPGTDIEGVLARAMSPPHFPITPAGLRGSWHFEALEPGEHRIEGFTVLALEIPHKNGRTFGYRVSDDRAALAYLSDHCPTSNRPGPDGLGEYHETALALADRADILFHDAQYTDEELPEKAHFGHSCAGYALGLAQRAQVGRLVLFHHDPWRTDAEVGALADLYQGGGLPVEAAREGATFDLP